MDCVGDIAMGVALVSVTILAFMSAVVMPVLQVYTMWETSRKQAQWNLCQNCKRHKCINCGSEIEQ